MTKPPSATRRPADTKDIRLALVLNGGVSLAVWMGGVTHELDLLRRASRGDREGLSEADRNVFEKWHALAERKHAKVSVDIVAGTSAGGLNGMLLATAIGRGAPLPNLRDMWEKSASLNELLKDRPTNSVLNGDSFNKALRAAVAGITNGRKSASGPITLFMTATALDGRPRPFKDSFEDSFDVRDHRRLYRFRHDAAAREYSQDGDGTWAIREVPYDDFNDGCTEALVEAAQATASFPVAFPAVNERAMIKYRRQPKPYLPAPASYVMDGGVLNNAPFGPVLEEITKRTMDSPLDRVVVYVVPSVGHISREGSAKGQGETIPWIETALNAVQYPREADFRSGTDDLSARLAASLRSSRPELFHRMSEQEGLTKVLLDAAKGLLGEYRRSRTIGVLWHIRRLLTDADTVTCLIAPAESKPDEILEIATGNPPWIPRWDENELVGARAVWHWGLTPATRVLETLCSHLHDLAEMEDDAQQGRTLDAQQRSTLINGAAHISERLHDALGIQEAVTKQLWARHPRGKELSDRSANQLLNEVFADLNAAEELGRIINEASECYVNARARAGLNPLPLDPVTACLAMEVVSEAYAPPPKITEPVTPPFTFLRLGPDKMSPLFDEDRYADLGDRKLYGIRFNHFAAFFDAEWRSSDFVWGRLDAAHHLLSLLVPDERERRAHEAELHQLILDAAAAEREATTRRKVKLPGLVRRTTATSRAASAEGTPWGWMRRHLDELTGTDQALLDQVLGSPEGKETLRAAIDSVHELLINPSPGSGTRVSRFWHTCLDYTRPVFARRKKDLSAGQNKRWLRWPTYYVRRRMNAAYRREPQNLPKELRKAMVRTGVGLAGSLALSGAAFGGFLGYRAGRRRH